METPNTRSRRKRELTEGAGLDIDGPVEWVHDGRLRTAVLEATRGYTPTLPTPTQQPRPISSLLSPSLTSTHQSTSSSTPSSSRPPPRKRPCRSSRSLPSNLLSSSTPSTSRSRPSSLPSTSRSDRDAIDGEQHLKLRELLDQAMVKFNISAPEGSGSPSCRQVKDRNLIEKPNGSCVDVKSGGKRGSSHSSSVCPPRNAPLQSLPHNIQHNITSNAGSIAATCKNATIIRPVIPSKMDSFKADVPKASETHGKSTDPRSNRPTSSTPLRQAIASPFKVPLASAQGVRSSPRRAAAEKIGGSFKGSIRGASSVASPLSRSKVPLREVDNGFSSQGSTAKCDPSHKPSTQSRSTSHSDIIHNTSLTRNRQQIVATNVNQPHSPNQLIQPRDEVRNHRMSTKDAASKSIHNSNFDIGENEGEGDNSFDSIDGMFQDGGPEIEALLRAVDGS